MTTKKMRPSAVLNLMGATAVLAAAWIALADEAVHVADAVPWPLLIQLVG
jgi:hypothetical protein